MSRRHFWSSVLIAILGVLLSGAISPSHAADREISVAAAADLSSALQEITKSVRALQ
jgi:ABC-type molybdate transport system substrate-binding protein